MFQKKSRRELNLKELPLNEANNEIPKKDIYLHKKDQIIDKLRLI